MLLAMVVCLFYLLLICVGYELTVKDMTLKRKYAHEWRESWEKIDTIREVMSQYPNHEWFWWLDLVRIISISSMILTLLSIRTSWNRLVLSMRKYFLDLTR